MGEHDGHTVNVGPVLVHKGGWITDASGPAGRAEWVCDTDCAACAARTPQEKVVTLMEALEQSVSAAKAARAAQHKNGRERTDG
jgi:hypothetical protein